MIILLALVLTVLAGGGCAVSDEQAVKVSLSDTEPAATTTIAPQPATPSIDIAVAAMISPKETLITYRELLDYVSQKTGVPTNLVQRETYAEINDLVRRGDVEMAFVCTGAYIEGKQSFGMELLVAPQMYGETYYYSYIIVPAGSPAEGLEDLRGKSFAFTDPLSNSGRLAPTYMLARMNETPESFFAGYSYTYSHDKSIEAVSEKVVDGAAVDSLIWNYFDWKYPDITAGTKVIVKSPPYGIPPVVVPAGLDAGLKEQLRDILLHMHEDEEGRRILADIKITRFVEVDDSIYDSVREMTEAVGRQ